MLLSNLKFFFSGDRLEGTAVQSKENFFKGIGTWKTTMDGNGRTGSFFSGNIVEDNSLNYPRQTTCYCMVSGTYIEYWIFQGLRLGLAVCIAIDYLNSSRLTDEASTRNSTYIPRS